MATTKNFSKNTDKEIKKMLSLLRRVYDQIEINHLTDHKLMSTYCGDINFKKGLGDEIFGYLQAKDQTFRDIVLRRQKNYIRKNKKNGPDLKI